MGVTIEVLLSAMYQSDFKLVDCCNIHTPCLIINQCDYDDYMEDDRDFGKVRMISTTERGLSKSRNMALRNSQADICVICDDDIAYKPGYENIIVKAFDELPDADVVVFNVNSLNPEIRPQEQLFTRVRKIPKHKTYGSVHIAFRRRSIADKRLLFDERFGSGSGLFSMGEDSLFFTQIHKSNLRSYTYPAVIADLSSETSTWFKGYNNKYFYDVGAFLSAAYPHSKNLLKLYYPIRFHRITDLSAVEIIHKINQGIKGFDNSIPYNDN